MCPGQEISGAFFDQYGTADYIIDIPWGATFVVTGSLDILAGSSSPVARNTVIFVDGVNSQQLGGMDPGPYFDQAFGGFGSWVRNQNYNAAGHVSIHVGQATNTRINWRMTITVTAGGGPPGACTTLAAKETTGKNCAEKNVAATQGTAGDPVNTATGNFNESFLDFAIPGRGAGLVLGHDYNSLQAAIDGPLGYGWTHAYAATMAIDGAGVATIHQETGAEVYMLSR